MSSPRFGTLWDEGNVYRGGAGNDRIWATAGADTFEFNLGDGYDTISDVQHDSLYIAYGGALERLAPSLDAAANEPAHRAALLSNTDTIAFGAGIKPADIEIVRVGASGEGQERSDTLVFRHRNGHDRIQFTNWYQADYLGVPIHNQLGRVVFADGTSWDRPTIEMLAATAPRQVTATDTGDFVLGGDADELILGGEGDDWLSGGEGNDILDGGAGDDALSVRTGRRHRHRPGERHRHVR